MTSTYEYLKQVMGYRKLITTYLTNTIKDHLILQSHILHDLKNGERWSPYAIDCRIKKENRPTTGILISVYDNSIEMFGYGVFKDIPIKTVDLHNPDCFNIVLNHIDYILSYMNP